MEFECLALGDPKPQVTWSKVGGSLRPGIVQSGGIIRIAHVELADAGRYRCTASNSAGATQSHVLLLVQGEGRQGLHSVGAQPDLPSHSLYSGPPVCLGHFGSRFPNKYWLKDEECHQTRELVQELRHLPCTLLLKFLAPHMVIEHSQERFIKAEPGFNPEHCQ